MREKRNGMGIIIEIREVGKRFDNTLFKTKKPDTRKAMEEINKFAKEKGLI